MQTEQDTIAAASTKSAAIRPYPKILVCRNDRASLSVIKPDGTYAVAQANGGNHYSTPMLWKKPHVTIWGPDEDMGIDGWKVDGEPAEFLDVNPMKDCPEARENDEYVTYAWAAAWAAHAEQTIYDKK